MSNKSRCLGIYGINSIYKQQVSSVKSLEPAKEWNMSKSMDNFIFGMSFSEVVARLCSDQMTPTEFANLTPVMFYTYIKERLNIAEIRKNESQKRKR